MVSFLTVIQAFCGRVLASFALELAKLLPVQIHPSNVLALFAIKFSLRTLGHSGYLMTTDAFVLARVRIDLSVSYAREMNKRCSHNGKNESGKVIVANDAVQHAD